MNTILEELKLEYFVPNLKYNLTNYSVENVINEFQFGVIITTDKELSLFYDLCEHRNIKVEKIKVVPGSDSVHKFPAYGRFYRGDKNSDFYGNKAYLSQVPIKISESVHLSDIITIIKDSGERYIKNWTMTGTDFVSFFSKYITRYCEYCGESKHECNCNLEEIKKIEKL